jgi:feruloyl esterase
MFVFSKPGAGFPALRAWVAVSVLALASPGPAAAADATLPSESCDRDAIQLLAPKDTTISFAAREPGVICHVNGYVTTQNPGPNRVLFVLALPDNFNGRYVYLGVGGAAGQLPAIKPSLIAKGYALAGSDAGTGARTIADFSFKSNPAKLVDFQWRAVKSSALATQQITRAYYRRGKIMRYISGCSGGGQMGMSNAIRFGGENFDGFISAATVWPGAAFKPNLYRIMQHMQNHPAGWLPPDLLRRAYDAIVARYDDTDGAKDGIIADARNIRDFDLGILRQVGFTPAQIETFQMITSSRAYHGPGIYGDGLQAGWPVSDLAGWIRYLTGTMPPPWPDTATHSTSALQAMGVPFYHVMADTNIRAQRPGLDYATISDERELISLATLGGTEVSTSELDLSKLAASGAKMIIWHGTADEANSYMDNLKGYQAVLAKSPTAANWLRLFLVPGLQHCRGGNGPTEVEDPMIDALATWVETGTEPASVLAPRAVPGKGVDRTFRLCPEPKRAVLKAPGLDPNAADNWECRTPQG